MDRISALSDDLILKILSSLFLKEVIATSVLSKRWRSLWKLLPKLKIGEDEFSKQNRYSISTSLALSNPQVLKNLDIINYNPIDCYQRINSWIEPAAVYGGLRELRIDLFYNSIELPWCLHPCETLETLILSRLELINVPSHRSFWSLKKRSLLSVRFSSDECVQKLLRNCPVLEDLVIRRSTYVNVDVFNIDVPTLKNLSIDYLHARSEPVGVHGFVINTPCLRYLNIRDRFSNLLQFTDMPKLVKANVKAICDQSGSSIES